MATITTPRPPLNLFNVSRINVSPSWGNILDVPDFLIPENGPNPSREVKAVALLTSLLIANNLTEFLQISIRVLDTSSQTWLILNEMNIPPNDFAVIEMGKQNLSSGEKLQLKVNADQAAVASLSYVLNQREEFTVIV